MSPQERENIYRTALVQAAQQQAEALAQAKARGAGTPSRDGRLHRRVSSAVELSPPHGTPVARGEADRLAQEGAK